MGINLLPEVGGEHASLAACQNERQPSALNQTTRILGSFPVPSTDIHMNSSRGLFRIICVQTLASIEQKAVLPGRIGFRALGDRK